MATLAEHALTGAPLTDWLIVDAHGHLGSAVRPDIAADRVEQVVEIMDRIGIDRLAASHMMSLTGESRRGNDLLAEAAGSHPGRFLPYAIVNPNRPDEIEPELDRCFGELKMAGIKTHCSFHDYPPDGPAFRRVYEYARDHGPLPVLGHSFGPAGVAGKIARDFPEVPFIIAHTGGSYRGRFPDELVNLAAELDNVYLDTVWSQVLFGSLEALVEAVGAEKILYGSDLCFESATHQIGRVLLADLPEADKELILGRNAARLFGLDEPAET